MGLIAGHRPREAPCSFTHGRQGDYAAGAPQCTGPQASSRVANSRVSAAAVSYGEATPLHSVHGVCLVSCSSALGELRQCIDTLSCDGSPYLRMSNLSVWLTPGQACRACGRNRQQSRLLTDAEIEKTQQTANGTVPFIPSSKRKSGYWCAALCAPGVRRRQRLGSDPGPT